MLTSMIVVELGGRKVALLHNDRDFDPFAAHLGLRVVD